MPKLNYDTSDSYEYFSQQKTKCDDIKGVVQYFPCFSYYTSERLVPQGVNSTTSQVTYDCENLGLRWDQKERAYFLLID